MKICTSKIICIQRHAETKLKGIRESFLWCTASEIMEVDRHMLVKCFRMRGMTFLLWIREDMVKVKDKVFLFHQLRQLLKMCVGTFKLLFNNCIVLNKDSKHHPTFF